MILPILCYHKVGDESNEGRFLNVHPDRLRSHVRYFLRRGYRAVAARDLANAVWPNRTFCLTFDDAYVSTVANGLPVLQDLGVTASLFAVAGLVGKTSAWDGERAAPLATWEHLLEAHRLGFEIGNHTWSHPFLAELDQSGVAGEISDCQEELERRGLSPLSIAYPYGSWQPACSEAASGTGLAVGLILGKRPARPTDNRFQLPRVVLGYGDSVAKMIYKIWVRPKLP